MSAVHRTVLPVRWSDQDLNRHVNNARVVTLIEEARLSAVAAWLGEDGVPDPARPRVVVSLSLDYLRPIDHGPELTAHVWVARLGRSSYTVAYELRQHGRAAARARTVLVQTDPATGRSVPLPEGVRTVLEGLVVPDPDPDPEQDPERSSGADPDPERGPAPSPGSEPAREPEQRAAAVRESEPAPGTGLGPAPDPAPVPGSVTARA
ncbi:thioesterase family protein [Kocuria sp. SM24M-10]|uniref:acyl-CoA thioesterase n=1 Tax=Kocuria sp. SM24M-10 TaxID=1660349 RepID=UPI000699D3F1|nr:thioesterase family protein [Kocuria sp. SM24M-10]